MSVAAVKPSNIRALYSPYQEMSLSQFCDRMEELYAAANAEPRLKRLRLTAELSQSDLAERTGLNLHTLQHYEHSVWPANDYYLGITLSIAF